jgi:hypothetical protein
MDIRSILSDHGLEGALTSSLDVDLNDINQRITDLNQFVSGAFYDGIVTEIEAKKISAYINILSEANRKVLETYNTIYGNEALDDGAVKDELFAAKAAYDLLYSTLITDINMAISDGISSQEEAAQVDESYLALMDGSARLERAFEVARDAILGKRTTVAEQNAIAYAEEMKTEITDITDAIDGRLIAMEGYVDGTFRDGIVTEFEAKNIQSYLESLKLQKTELDYKYEEVYKNYFLTGVPKLNLLDAKGKYDEKYLNLVNVINTAIEDGIATPLESDNVRQAFVELDTALSLLVNRFEIAIDSLSQARADEAERLAKEAAAEYTDREVGTIDTILKEIVSDDKITKLERSAIKDDVTKITGVILGDEQNMPDIAAIDLARKGELYSARKEAFNIGFATNELDIVTLEEAYTELATYLNAFTPKPWDVASEANIDVDKLVWRTKWLDYYLAVAVLRERIAERLNNTNNEILERVESAEATILLHDSEILLRITKDIYEVDMQEVNERLNNAETKIGYDCEVHSTNGYVFRNGEISTTVFAVVYRGTENVTDSLLPSQFIWKRISNDPEGDEVWNNEHVNVGKTFSVTKDDVYARATFTCDIVLTEEMDN